MHFDHVWSESDTSQLSLLPFRDLNNEGTISKRYFLLCFFFFYHFDGRQISIFSLFKVYLKQAMLKSLAICLTRWGYIRTSSLMFNFHWLWWQIPVYFSWAFYAFFMPFTVCVCFNFYPLAKFLMIHWTDLDQTFKKQSLSWLNS